MKKLVGFALLGTLAAAVIYEILDREKPEWVQDIKDWFEAEDDEFAEPEEMPAE